MPANGSVWTASSRRFAGFDAQHVCVTGGEPLAQPNCLTLLERLCDAGFEVSLETSGALDIAAVDARVSRVVDVKTPGSRRSRAQPDREFRAADAARSGEIRDLLPRGLRLEQGVLAASTGCPGDAGYCSRPATSKSRQRSWRTGFWRTGCRCDFKCSFTRFCGATCRASDVVASFAHQARHRAAVGRTRLGHGACHRAAQGFECYALSVHYGQRHSAELDAARQIAAHLGAREHRVMGVDLAGIGGSALTDPSVAVPESPDRRHSGDLCAGAQHPVAVAGSGLGRGRRCGRHFRRRERRRLFRISRLPAGIHRGIREPGAARDQGRRRGRAFRIQAPLIAMSKAEIIRAGCELGVDYGMTVSCYQARADGAACGQCDSCRLRAAGFRPRASRIPRAIVDVYWLMHWR